MFLQVLAETLFRKNGNNRAKLVERNSFAIAATCENEIPTCLQVLAGTIMRVIARPIQLELPERLETERLVLRVPRAMQQRDFTGETVNVTRFAWGHWRAQRRRFETTNAPCKYLQSAFWVFKSVFRATRAEFVVLFAG